MNLIVLLAIAAALVAVQLVVTRWVRLNRLAWLSIWWIALWAAFSYGINPPLPQSIVVLFMAIITIALLAYLSADSEELAEARRTLVSFMVERRYQVALIVVIVAVPLLVALNVFF